MCDKTVNELTAKLLIPVQRSGLSFNRGVLMRVEYRIDRTKIKKEAVVILIMNLFNVLLEMYVKMISRECTIILKEMIHTSLIL